MSLTFQTKTVEQRSLCGRPKNAVALFEFSGRVGRTRWLDSRRYRPQVLFATVRYHPCAFPTAATAWKSAIPSGSAAPREGHYEDEEKVHPELGSLFSILRHRY
jgi:hypothetical protein